MKKKSWWKPPIESKGTVACLCCGEAAEILPMETKLYGGYGGWNIVKNGKQEFFCDRR